MIYLGFTLRKFQTSLPEDGGRPSKHVVRKFVCKHTVRLVRESSFFLMIQI
jgi:hypothetical protein